LVALVQRLGVEELVRVPPGEAHQGALHSTKMALTFARLGALPIELRRQPARTSKRSTQEAHLHGGPDATGPELGIHNAFGGAVAAQLPCCGDNLRIADTGG
jgi:hypothetical protein